MARAVQAVLAAVLTLSVGCSSYYIRRADAAAEAGDYQTARELYHQAATNNMNGYARFQLAKIYEEGLGVDANPSEALRWYRGSADLGNRFAQYKAGLLLELGHGTDKNQQEAAKYYEVAAHQGEALAALRLGELSLAGSGVEQSAPRARSLFEGAAQQGNIQAAYRLGQLLLSATGGAADHKNGIGWLLVAAHDGHALAQTALARAILDGDGGGIDRSVAKEWFLEAAERGNTAAQHELSNLMSSQGASEQGHRWRMESAKAGYIPAQIAVAELCQQTQPDGSYAAYWYTEAANRGNAYSQYQMGRLSETGHGVPRDLDEARRWYALAAERDMIAAKQRLRALGGI